MKLTIIAFYSALTAIAPLAYGQVSAVTDPAGYIETVTALPNSDTYVGLPLALAPEFAAALSANASISGNTATLSFAPNPGWTTDQFANLYYVRFTSGPLNGRFYTVSANTNNTLTVLSGGDNLSGAVTGNTLKLIKYWTLQGLFPKETQTTFVVSSSNLAPNRKSELLTPDLASSGTNLAPSGKFFITSTGWKQATTGFPDASNVVLYPDTYFIIRHPAGVTATKFTIFGTVPMENHSFALGTLASGQQDNFIALSRPADVTLQASGFASGFVASSNNLAPNRRDELFVYDNSTAVQNRAPSRKFFMVGSNWIENVTGFPNANAVVLKPGDAIMIRKYAAAGGVTANAINPPNYTNN